MVGSAYMDGLRLLGAKDDFHCNGRRKPVAVTMTVAEILTIAALLDAISVYIGHRLGDRSVILIVVGFVIASLNLRTALGKNKILNALRAQFEIYSLPARISGAIVVILLIVLSAIAAGLLGEAVSHLPH